MSRYLDIAGLRYFKTKILEVVQQMINASASSEADHAMAIEQYVRLYNAFMGTSYNYRDYLSCKPSDIQKALDDMSRGSFGN